MSRISPETLAQLAGTWAVLDGLALLETAIRGPQAVAVAALTSFGTESAVLLDLIARIDPGLPVIVLDTGELFDETTDYIRTLSAHLGLTRVTVTGPTEAERQAAEDLWETDANRCCGLRKVAPLARAVVGFDALIDGRRRAHGFERAAMPTVEVSGGTLKLSPLAGWSDSDIEIAFVERGLPRHPLEVHGYRSIGCWPCTRPVKPGEPARAGRWAGAAKTECGIHTRPLVQDVAAAPLETGKPNGLS
ncbi:phosphoadenylyl-sulfate reductase [Magnetospirillum molischianum]|uniref:Adenosine 5'-phosphosulfate reductase n=1 Tax=Magnetospirillum molischianum DSM 120 TaxID=1150626 RepID=H8FU42_MAGML|nr:phosphoadenylyl-sulfate reductase [Magnetospirillum molischianum]CCG41880.1 phosphoadenosine phosphosulfate reductase(PAPS reductase, thioredoxin dependent) (PAdoPS reductase) (3'-phosphoadenylylsulfate reductase) (PAPS sulfotransferase) [Magnetospirillum molischianum DSM 120]